MALIVALRPARKSRPVLRMNSSILFITHWMADIPPAKAGDLRLPQSLIGSSPHLLGDRDVIWASLDFKAHRGFASSPIAAPKSPPGIRRNSSILLILHLIADLLPTRADSCISLDFKARRELCSYGCVASVASRGVEARMILEGQKRPLRPSTPQLARASNTASNTSVAGQNGDCGD